MNENQDPILGQSGEPQAAPVWNPAQSPAGESAWQAGPAFSESAERPAADPFADSFDSESELYVIPVKRPKKHRGVLIGLGCLLLVLLAAGGWWLLNSRSRNPLKELKQAVDKSMDSYLDFVKELPNLHESQKNLLDFEKSDSKHIALNVALEGVSELPDMSLQIGMDLDGKAKAALLHGQYVSGQLTVPVDLYLDPEQIQLGSDALLQTGEVLGITTKDFGKKWNSSVFSSMAKSAELPDDFSLAFLMEGLSEQAMLNTFGEDWTAFVDSVSYRKATADDGKDFFTVQGDSYVLVWDQDLLNKIGQKAESIMRGWTGVPDMGRVFPTLAVAALHAASDELDSIKFRVANNGALVGFSVQEKNERDEKGVVLVELLGETNPWSRCAITLSQWNASTQEIKVLSAQEYTMTVADGKLRTKSSMKDEHGNEMTLMEIVYNDADGSYTYTLSDDFDEELTSTFTGSSVSDMMNAILDGIDVRMLPTKDGGTKLEESFNLDGISSPMLSLQGKLKLSLELNTKTEPVKPLSDQPTQLLEMDQAGLTALVMRAMQRLGLGGFGQ